MAIPLFIILKYVCNLLCIAGSHKNLDIEQFTSSEDNMPQSDKVVDKAKLGCNLNSNSDSDRNITQENERNEKEKNVLSKLKHIINLNKRSHNVTSNKIYMYLNLQIKVYLEDVLNYLANKKIKNNKYYL